MPESKISYRSEPFCTAFRAVFAGYDKHQIVHEQATQRARQPGNTVEWRRCNEINIIMPGGFFLLVMHSNNSERYKRVDETTTNPTEKPKANPAEKMLHAHKGGAITQNTHKGGKGREEISTGCRKHRPCDGCGTEQHHHGPLLHSVELTLLMSRCIITLFPDPPCTYWRARASSRIRSNRLWVRNKRCTPTCAVFGRTYRMLKR